MRLVPAVVVGLVVTTLVVPTASSTAAPVPVVQEAAPSYADAVPGPALPARPRTPNAALFVGADDDYVLYHSGHVDPASEQVDYTLVSLDDGHVVRTFQAPQNFRYETRLVDGAIVEIRGADAVRTNALTGSVTGTVAEVSDDFVALDDEWVLTSTDVRWFDGRPPVPLSDEIGPDPLELRLLGDSTLAVVAESDGERPVVVTPETGEVVSIDHGDFLRVFAARGGADPVLYGVSYDGLVRWSDPAHDAGRTVVDTDEVPFGGGLAGDRLLVHVGSSSDEYVAELDPATGEVGPPLADVTQHLGLGGSWTSYGDRLAQAGDGLVVSGGETPRGEIVLVNEASVRDLGAPRPSPLVARTLQRSASVVHANFEENGETRGAADLVVGEPGWTTVPEPGTPPTPHADSPGSPTLTCADSSRSRVGDARGRWQIESCPGAIFYVTDRSRVVPPWRIPGIFPQLGAGHVAYAVPGADPDDRALVITGLDAHHDSRVYGPLSDDYVFSVDLVGSEDPVYADASGQVRLAPARGLADTTGPVISDVHAPPSAVVSVRPVRLAFSARARDAVDGDDVVIRVQTRRAPRLRPLGPWQTEPSSASGRVTVSAQPGEEWCFRAVAADRSGNVTVDDPGTCSTVPLDDRVLRRVGPVGSSESKGYLGGDAARLAGPRGSLVVGAVRGTRPILYLRSGPRGGVLVVRQAGRVVQRVDTRARRPGLLVVLVQRPGVPLRLQARGQRPVLVDAIGHRRLS